MGPHPPPVPGGAGAPLGGESVAGGRLGAGGRGSVGTTSPTPASIRAMELGEPPDPPARGPIGAPPCQVGLLSGNKESLPVGSVGAGGLLPGHGARGRGVGAPLPGLGSAWAAWASPAAEPPPAVPRRRLPASGCDDGSPAGSRCPRRRWRAIAFWPTRASAARTLPGAGEPPGPPKEDGGRPVGARWCPAAGRAWPLASVEDRHLQPVEAPRSHQRTRALRRDDVHVVDPPEGLSQTAPSIYRAAGFAGCGLCRYEGEE